MSKPTILHATIGRDTYKTTLQTDDHQVIGDEPPLKTFPQIFRENQSGIFYHIENTKRHKEHKATSRSNFVLFVPPLRPL